jgi:hypothetical protein
VIIATIDPGKWCLPWCAWQPTRELAYAGLSLVGKVPGMPVERIARLHYENIARNCPELFERVHIEQLSLNSGRDKTRGKAIATGNDLLELTSIAALVAGYLRASVTYHPVNTWKGTAPKEITRNRVRATLGPLELHVLDAALAAVGRKKSLHHNLYDAAGIGLHATGRYRIRGARTA